MKKILLAALVALIAVLLGANTASAQTTDWADGVWNFSQGLEKGGGAVTPARSDPSEALGPSDGVFVSLGYEGTLELEFPAPMSGSLELAVQEVTGGSYPEELADVSVSLDGSSWMFVGTASNEEGVEDGISEFFPQVRCFQYVRIVDATDSSLHSDSSDGFDVDAVSATYDEECPPPEPEPDPDPSHDIVINMNDGHVHSGVIAIADTGGNSADGSYAGDGGRGGDIRNDGDDVDDSTTGRGGAGGDSGPGGYIETGDATAEAGAMILVNSNVTRINRCACDDAQEGHTLVINANRGSVGNLVLAHADTGDNRAGGSEAGDGGRGGDIRNGEWEPKGDIILKGEPNGQPNGDHEAGDVDDSATGNGGAGGDSGLGATIVTGDAESRALAFIALNRNDTRILR